MNSLTVPSVIEAGPLAPPPLVPPPLVDYGQALEGEITRLAAQIAAAPALSERYPPRWLAITLLEGDSDLTAKIAALPGGADLLAEAAHSAARVAEALGEDVETLIADRRYAFIAQVVGGAVIRPAHADVTRSDQVDRVVTHPWLGVPVFLALMWLVFQMTANVSGIFLDWVDGVITGPLARWVGAVLGAAGLGGSWVKSLLLDGILAGAGGVLSFIPVLMFLYFFLALLEDSGYMARAAFVMDRLMQMLGLHGKSFIPLLVGFGCSVPGIYATRTLEDRRTRILTGLLVPFMSCAARLPVYVLIGAAFFGAHSGNLIFAMYLLGVGVAVLSGLLLRRTLFKAGEELPFVMELPPFRRPSLTTIRRQVWQRTMGFVSHVWSLIMIASIVVWALLNFPYQNGHPPAMSDSLFGGVSRTLAPALRPAGFGNWQAAGSLVSGLVAKEVVISTMAQVYGVEQHLPAADETPTFVEDVTGIVRGFGTAALDTVKATISLLPGVNLLDTHTHADDTALQGALRSHFSPLQAIAFSVFVLLYTPCMATIGALRHEFGARWMAFSVVYMLLTAWIGAVLVYQIGGLLL